MFERIGVVGAGQMGSRISWAIAKHGKHVTLFDTDPAALARARAAHIAFSGEAPCPIVHESSDISALAESDLVIEAIAEQVDAKRSAFAAIEKIVRPDTVIATNSSSIPVSQIESALARPERALNMHFYMTMVSNPTIVELMAGSQTDPRLIEASRDFLRGVGLVPLIVQRESVGFIFNRIWRAIKRECLTIVEDGVASIEDVDRAWMIMYQAKSGPFGRMDSVGLDVTLDIERVYHAASGHEIDEPPQYLIDMVAAGTLGKKSGQGFYQYPNPSYEEPNFLQS